MSDCQHGDDSRHADDDAQQGQCRPEEVRPQGPEGHFYGLDHLRHRRRALAGMAVGLRRRRDDVGGSDIGNHASVLQFDHSLCAFSDFRVVRDQDDRTSGFVQLLKQAEQFVARSGVQGAGRFICEDDFRVVDQSASHSDTLLLATGKLVRFVVEAVAQPQPGQKRVCFFLALRMAEASVDRRDLDVFRRRNGCKKIVALEDEAESFTPHACEFVSIQIGDILPTHPIGAVCRPVEAAKDVHQGRFAGSRLTDNGDELAGMNIERDAIQGAHFGIARSEIALHMLEADERGVHRAAPSGPSWGAVPSCGFDCR